MVRSPIEFAFLLGWEDLGEIMWALLLIVCCLLLCTERYRSYNCYRQSRRNMAWALPASETTTSGIRASDAHHQASHIPRVRRSKRTSNEIVAIIRTCDGERRRRDCPSNRLLAFRLLTVISTNRVLPASERWYRLGSKNDPPGNRFGKRACVARYPRDRRKARNTAAQGSSCDWRDSAHVLYGQ